ncbi:MAG: hypothetical protein AAFU64_08145 [Bacteroidota bacterium]
MNRFLLSVLLSLGMMGSGLAQSTPSQRFYLELEPLQFINRGWSILGHYAIKERWQVGMNVFASRLSEGQNDYAFEIEGDIDLEARQDFGLNLSVRFFIKKRAIQRGWVISLPIGGEIWTLKDKNLNQEENYRFLYISPRVGYLWFPFKKKRFFILAEAVAIIPVIKDDPLNLGEARISFKPFVPFPGIGRGGSF